MWREFDCRIPGKWVLAGEHAVLRGATAIALAHPTFSLRLSFRPGGENLRIDPSTAAGVVTDLLGSVADFWESEGRSFPRPEGTLSLQSSIPVGAGLGSSAALCVALARWMREPLGMGENEVLEFATRLEHRFHGRSSGMDIAAVSAGEPISFVAGRGPRPLGIRKLPAFTFHDTGLRSRTSECVVRVEKLREEDPGFAMRIDEAMSKASRSCMEGLARYDSGESEGGLQALTEGMRQAQECFYSWQLVPGEARRIEQDLTKKGALATKLTGAGGGGVIVALWQDREQALAFS